MFSSSWLHLWEYEPPPIHHWARKNLCKYTTGGTTHPFVFSQPVGANLFKYHCHLASHIFSYFSTLHGSSYIVCATSWQFYYIPLLLAIITHNTEVANYLVFHLASEPITRILGELTWMPEHILPSVLLMSCNPHGPQFSWRKKQHRYGGYKNEVIFNHNHQSTPWNFSKTYIPFITEQCALIIMKLQDRNVQSPNPQEL